MVAGWLTLCLLAAGALVVQLTGPRTVIDNSVGVWFLADDPNLAEYESNNSAFGSREWSILLLDTVSVADPAFLRDLAQLTTELEAVPHVRRVLSLASVRGLTMVPGKGPAFVPLLDPAAADPAVALRAGLARLPSMERLLLPQGWGIHTALLVQSDNFLHDLEPYRLELVDAVHRLATARPSVRNHAFAGTTVINAELNRSARRDALRFYILVTTMVLLFGWLALRDLRDLAIVLAVLAVAVLAPMGGIAQLGIPFNMVTILLPLILVSLAVCDVIHVINTFHSERREHAEAAARAAVSSLWTPCLWTTLVTVAGMLSLALSSVAPIRQMGLATSAGLALAWACTMTMVPALLVLFWRKPRGANAGWVPGKYASRLQPLLAGNWRWVWLVLAGLLALPIAGLNHLRIDTDYTQFFSPGTPVSRAYREVAAAGFAQSVVEIVVTAPQSGGLLDRGSYRRALSALESRAANLPGVRNTLSEGQLLQGVDEAINGAASIPRWIAYPDAAIAQLRAVARSAGMTEIDDYSTPDGRCRRILLLTDYLSSTDMRALRDSVAAIAGELLPQGARASLQGTTVLWANMDGEIARTQVRSILMLAAVFVLLLPILFGSLRLGLLGVVINGLPLAMTFGLMGLLGSRLNMATALIGGVAIGSTVDSTLFFINRFKKELALGRTWNDAIEAAVRGVGDGILITTGILTGGFLCMTVSSFTPTAEFGIFTCFTIVTGAFLDIVIDPILLGFMASRGGSKFAPRLTSVEIPPKAG
jgi:hypothetical protein